MLGAGVVVRGELKNALVMDRAELAHPGCGPSHYPNLTLTLTPGAKRDNGAVF